MIFPPTWHFQVNQVFTFPPIIALSGHFVAFFCARCYALFWKQKEMNKNISPCLGVLVIFLERPDITSYSIRFLVDLCNQYSVLASSVVKIILRSWNIFALIPPAAVLLSDKGIWVLRKILRLFLRFYHLNICYIQQKKLRQYRFQAELIVKEPSS